jgi:adenylate cyclase
VRKRTARRLRIIVGVTLFCAALGVVFTARYGLTRATVLSGLVSGGLFGLIITSLEVYLVGRGAVLLRRLPVGLVLALRIVLYAGAFLAVKLITDALPGVVGSDSSFPGGAIVSGANVLFFIGTSLAINLFFLVQSLLGQRTLTALLTGRYFRPKAEERIVLFLDLHGSTPLAERLGDRDFHRFLNQVFFDITDPVIEAGGEIYRYVGDEIIVTWRRARGADEGACIACLFAIEDALDRRREYYVRAFGAAPRLRGDLHIGKLIVGEMGDLKREIVMLGDTMNTTARIVETCRATGRDHIASDALLACVPSLPPSIRAESLGKLPLRGKTGEIELFALSRG